MNGLILFVEHYWIYTIALIIVSIIPSIILARQLELLMGKQLIEALADRNKYLSIYSKCINTVNQAVRDYDKRDKKASIYIRARMKMKKAGYIGDYSAFVYILLKYGMTFLIFFVALLFNYPDFIKPLVLGAVLVIIIELVVAGEKRKINLKFQKYIYKIYKYLHNQISSGVKVTDAVRTVYEVIDDKHLRNVLIRLAARYELTLDIDSALEDFKSNFDIHEAGTLCVALKQGVDTGDNQELLARQEDVMFKKYFNYIQAETDSCKTRSLLAVAMFTAIVVLMIIIPLFNDMSDAVSKIFIN